MNIIDMLNEAWNTGFDTAFNKTKSYLTRDITAHQRSIDIHRIIAQHTADDMVVELIDDLPNALRTLEEAALRGSQLHGDDIPRLRAACDRLTNFEWQPIETAPHNRPILIYAPAMLDLPYIICTCQWHEDAGFCIDELHTPTHWMPLPEPPK